MILHRADANLLSDPREYTFLVTAPFRLPSARFQDTQGPELVTRKVASGPGVGTRDASSPGEQRETEKLFCACCSLYSSPRYPWGLLSHPQWAAPSVRPSWSARCQPVTSSWHSLVPAPPCQARAPSKGSVVYLRCVFTRTDALGVRGVLLILFTAAPLTSTTVPGT